MSPDTIFNVTCVIAAIGWLIILVVSPFWQWWDKFVVGIIIVLLALVYTVLNFSNFKPADVKKFGSLDGIFQLYQNRSSVTASWVHVLAFDLMVAVWIKKDAIR